MKNLHLLPTEKASKIFKDDFGKLFYSINIDQEQNHFKPQHIYITNDAYIGLSYYLDGDLVRKGVIDDQDYWAVRRDFQKIILTTDQDLIKDGVQSIDDEFLEWFVKNPSCEYVTVYDGIFGEDRIWKKYIIIPKEELKQTDEKGNPLTYWGGLEEPKINSLQEAILNNGAYEHEQETLEEAAKKYMTESYQKGSYLGKLFIAGAKWQAEKINIDKAVLEARIEEAEHNLRMLKLHGNGKNRGYALSRLGELRRELEKYENGKS